MSIPAAVLSIVSYCKVEVYGELMRYLIQSIMEYEEHEKRAWSVDFSRTDPTMLVSGSDDGKVGYPLAHLLVLELSECEEIASTTPYLYADFVWSMQTLCAMGMEKSGRESILI